MCGRYYRRSDKQKIAEAFHASLVDNGTKPPIDLLRPFPADEMETFEVSKALGNVKNNSPELLE